MHSPVSNERSLTLEPKCSAGCGVHKVKITTTRCTLSAIWRDNNNYELYFIRKLEG
jgi:hypothetical protein